MSDIETLIPTTNDWIQQENFNVFLESLLTYIQTNYISSQLQVTDFVASIYKGDFYGLLSSQGIIPDLWYITLRINGLYNPMDFDGQAFVLIVPQSSYITTLANTFKTTQTA